jgi:hypothetical protein
MLSRRQRCLLYCNSVSICKEIPTFRRNILPPSSELILPSSNLRHTIVLTPKKYERLTVLEYMKPKVETAHTPPPPQSLNKNWKYVGLLIFPVDLHFFLKCVLMVIGRDYRQVQRLSLRRMPKLLLVLNQPLTSGYRGLFPRSELEALHCPPYNDKINNACVRSEVLTSHKMSMLVLWACNAVRTCRQI